LSIQNLKKIKKIFSLIFTNFLAENREFAQRFYNSLIIAEVIKKQANKKTHSLSEVRKQI